MWNVGYGIFIVLHSDFFKVTVWAEMYDIAVGLQWVAPALGVGLRDETHGSFPDRHICLTTRKAG
jgi:hypothetical protein